MKAIFLFCIFLFANTISKAQVKSVEYDNTKNESVFTFVEQMPEFPGGEQALYKFLSDNIVYPKTAKEQGLEAKIYIRFVVTETGEITNPVSMKQSPKILEDEAIRVIKAMPKWRPGKQNGRAVSVFFQLPIYFHFEEDGNLKKK